MALFPDPIEVELGNKTYAVRPLKWKRLKPLKKAIIAFLSDIDRTVNLTALFVDLTNPNANVPKVIASLDEGSDLLLERAPAILKMGIPELALDLFGDDATEEQSPDVLQVWDAFAAIARANRMEFIKNLWAGAANAPTTSSSPTSPISTATPPPNS